ncbi:Transposable element Tc3 transposase, partial [Stegodyphus mimosarum]
MSSRAIAIKIGRSKTVVNNFLKLKDNYGKKNTGGRPKALSSRDERRVCQLVSTGKYSTRKLISTTGLKVCQKTIYNTIRRSGRFTYTAKLTKPQLLQRHKIERLNFGQKVMSWDNQWIEIIFSDEKKWNLDGPDGWNFYWHDIRNEKEIFSKRQLGGVSVMTWGCFAYSGVGSIAFVSGRMNSQGYQNLLRNHLLPNAECLAGENWKYQQDNASIHSSNSTKNWFQVNNVETVKWPARSPDLNPVENLWGDLARRVYANGRHFTSTTELKSTIEDEWYKTDPTLCQKLVSSMKTRIFEVGNSETSAMFR